LIKNFKDLQLYLNRYKLNEIGLVNKESELIKLLPITNFTLMSRSHQIIRKCKKLNSKRTQEIAKTIRNSK